ncbi:hypothetical protein MKZ38_010082 [Zalerion maritima]|uniref:Xylanolytic transcriptional activator regulatory domain-containing protein n=1 Tax=Zalerion maritima TaxID=339359 RepID=A0AAD5RSP6_9PEZI|nr:hypothetical protein MKZ38_010082 [Zalerion maritima]
MSSSAATFLLAMRPLIGLRSRRTTATRRLQCTYPEGSTIRRPPGSQSGDTSYDPQHDAENNSPGGAYQPYGPSPAMSVPQGHSSTQGFSGAAGDERMLPSGAAQMADRQAQYNQPTIQAQYSQSALPPGEGYHGPGQQDMIFASGVPPQQTSHTMRNPMSAYPAQFEPQMPVDIYTSPAQQAPYVQTGYQSSFDFPLNWLPANDAIDINYSSLLPYGVTPPQADPDTNMQEVPDQQMSGVRSGMSSITANRVMRDGMDCSPSAQAASPAATSSTMSRPGTDGGSSSAPGGLYATSADGARVPCTARQRRPSIAIYGANLASTVTDGASELMPDSQCFAFPNLSHISFRGADDVLMTPKRTISSRTYDTIHKSFQTLCSQPGVLYPAYTSGHFPSKDHLNLFVHLYFEYFSSTMPIVREDFEDIEECWPLALAVAAIGCHYTQTREFSNCIAPIHEFLRRVIATDMEVENRLSILSIPMTQAFILSQLGMLYSGSSRLFRLAESRQGLLISIVNAHSLLSSPRNDQPDRESMVQWGWEIQEETKRRLGYSVFLLDTMRAYHFEQKPFLSLKNCQTILPDDSVWKSKTIQEASLVRRNSKITQSLATAIRTLFVEKQLEPSLGEFARAIILHGIYHEIFQIKAYHQRSLSTWTPSAQTLPAGNANAARNNNSHFESSSRKHLVEIPAYASWRNASLDCIDVLHWAANAAIAQMSGAEPPIVHHLHMARVVLLTPYKEIRTLAHSVVSLGRNSQPGGQHPSREDGLVAEREVAHWAQHDEHKARLAMIHCGCLFWHVRRYSTMGFYEPLSVFLATLALWAYSSYTLRDVPKPDGCRNSTEASDQEASRSGSISREESPGRQAGGAQFSATPDSPSGQPVGGGIIPSVPILLSPMAPENDLESHHPTFIRLDRPNDDEMVQLFVRSGRPSKMRAHVAGVGDICSPQGPARILRQGIKLLQGVSMSWGRTREYARVLKAVEDITSRDGAGTVGAQQNRR